MREYKDVWLIQRLEKPKRPTQYPTTPFTFGCVPNGKLSKEALELLRGVWSFDYMGAAEYEFGDVPKALSVLASSACATGVLEMSYSDVKKPYVPRDEKLPVKKGKFPIYFICPASDADPCVEAIKAVVTDKKEIRDGLRLVDSIYGRPYADIVGWLALDPAFMFFIDQEMWGKATQLFVNKKMPDAATRE